MLSNKEAGMVEPSQETLDNIEKIKIKETLAEKIEQIGCETQELFANYYPRGRVEISHNKAVIYLNPHINKPDFIDEIIREFGLSSDNIPDVRVKNDGSEHYCCFLDWQ